MREDHLIDAPADYAHRLRAGAANLALSGWALAACVVLSTVKLPGPHGAPLARTGVLVVMLGLLTCALALWGKAWWRLTDARTEALCSHAVTLGSNAVRLALLALVPAFGAWLLAASLRAITTPTDDNLALLLVRTEPTALPIAVGALVLAIFATSQGLARALRERTDPAKPGVFALPCTLATLPVGLVTLPGAMNQPSVLAFVTMSLALLFAFHGAQGAILRHRIARVLRARRRAEVLAAREPVHR